MDRFGVGEALAGDLVERYARRRSHVWFWRQALLAIALGSVKDVVEHKLLFARALLIGYASLWALTNLAYIVVPLFMDVTPIRHFAVLRLLTIVTFITIGWLIGRFHRPYSGAMVLGFIAVAWLISGPQTVRHISNVLQHERFLPYVEAWFRNQAAASICVLAGGILSGSRAPTSKSVRDRVSYNPSQ